MSKIKRSRCRHLSTFTPWIHEIMGMYWTIQGWALAPCKIPEICEIQIYIDIPVYLTVSGKLISTSLFVSLFGFMYFFQFLPLSSTFFRKKLEEIPFFQFLPFFPEETYFFRKLPNPARSSRILRQLVCTDTCYGVSMAFWSHFSISGHHMKHYFVHNV